MQCRRPNILLLTQIGRFKPFKYIIKLTQDNFWPVSDVSLIIQTFKLIYYFNYGRNRQLLQKAEFQVSKYLLIIIVLSLIVQKILSQYRTFVHLQLSALVLSFLKYQIEVDWRTHSKKGEQSVLKPVIHKNAVF